MPKRIRWSNNERVDVPDLQAATSGGDSAGDAGFAEQYARHLTVESVLTKYAAVLEGFRVEVPDQATFPGQFTVHNAFAYDRDGRVLNDESEYDAAISMTLPGGPQQYYLEVEMTTVADDVDSRAFWDQTYDNGTQPSGDPQQPGREFALNVSTRMTPTWQIVSPVSTTGFAVTTNPNTTRIPVCTLETNGLNEIINITKQVPAQSVLVQDYAGGTTSIKLHNTRIFPDSFTLTLVKLVPPAAPLTDVVTVVANDRENGILTLAGGGLAFSHFAGERAYNSTVGAPQFIEETATPMVLPTAGSGDGRPRFWAANEQAGFAALRNPDVNAGYTDTQIATLRDEVNALAASIREMRWGGFVPGSKSHVVPYRIGQNAQANGFTPNPRWFEPAGGIQGAKVCTVSIGDGSLSFGDYITNSGTYNNIQECFQAAINKIAESGATSGVLYIKRSASPYALGTATTVSIPAMTGGLRIIGDGDMTDLRIDDRNVPFFTIASAAKVHFENLKITRNGVSATEPGVYAQPGSIVSAKNAYIDGLNGQLPLLGPTTVFVELDGCTIVSTGAHANKSALLGSVVGVARNCSFLSFVNDPSARTIYLADNSRLSTHDCFFANTGNTSTAAVELSTNSTFLADAGRFAAPVASVGWAGVRASAGSREVSLSRCLLPVSSGNYRLVDTINVSQLSVIGCDVTFPVNGVGIQFAGGKATIRDCVLTQSAPGASAITSSKAIYFEGGDKIDISNIYIKDADYGIVTDNAATTTQNLSIRDVTFYNSSATSGIAAVYLKPQFLLGCSISNCSISGLRDITGPGGATHGIFVQPDSTGSGQDVLIDGNKISVMYQANYAYPISVGGAVYGLSICENVIGSNTAALVSSVLGSSGIRVFSDGTNVPSDVSITGNKLMNINGDVDVFGIEVDAYSGLSVANNVIRVIGSATSTGDAYALYFGWNTGGTGTAQTNSATITGNSIRLVECDGASGNFARGIYGLLSVARVTITGNSIADCKNGGNGGDGIVVDGANTGSYLTRDLIIQGNCIAPTDPAAHQFRDGINVQGLVTADNEGHVVISDNNVFCFWGTGIRAYPQLGQTFYDLVISGNSVRTDIAADNGIAVGKVIGFAITGNNINLSLVAQNSNGIYMNEVDTSVGTIGSNSIRVNNPNIGYYGIYFAGTLATISGNLVWTGTALANNGNGLALPTLGSKCLIGVNQFQTGNAAYDADPMVLLGTGFINPYQTTSRWTIVDNANARIANNCLNWSSDA